MDKSGEVLDDLTEEQRRELFEKFRKNSEETQKKVNAAVQEVLLPHQLERLEEIRMQLLGTGALLLEPVQKKLKITDAQKTKLYSNDFDQYIELYLEHHLKFLRKVYLTSL